jgi:HAD superfamily hydrolase (TIGR01509 family)
VRVAVRELVWDMDGTLLDSGVAVPAAFIAAVRRLGGPAIDADQVVASYGRGTPEVILAHLLGRDLGPLDAEAYYLALGEASVTAFPGVADVIGALRARGRPIVVFTGASSRAAWMLLGQAGLSADVLVGGDQVQYPKPAPDGLELAAARLGVATAELAYIGDSPLDVRAAAAAGCLGAAAAWGDQYDPAEPAACTLAAPPDALTLLNHDPEDFSSYNTTKSSW